MAADAGSCTGSAGRARSALTGPVSPALTAPAPSTLARAAAFLLLAVLVPLSSCGGRAEHRRVAVVPDTLAGFRLGESLPDLRAGLAGAAAALHCYQQVDGIHTGCRLDASASPRPFGTVSLDLEYGRVSDVVASLAGEWATAEVDTIFARFTTLYGADPDTVVHDSMVASATWFDPAGVRNASVVCLFLGGRSCSISLQPGTIQAADARTDSAWAARSAKRDSARAGAVVTVRPQDLEMLAGDLTGLRVRLEKVRVLGPVLRGFQGPYWLVTTDYGEGEAVFTNCPGTRLRPGRILRIQGTIRSYDAARRRFPALDIYPDGVWLDPDSCAAVR